MLNKDSQIGVISRTFCRSKGLRILLDREFNNVKYNEDLKHFNQEDLIEFLKGCEGIIVAEDKISKRVLNELPSLKVVSKFGVGLNNIDVDYLNEKNIHFHLFYVKVF